MQRYKKKLLITNKWRRFFCFGRHWYGMELVSAIMANSHYAIAKVQKVLGLTSGKREKFGLGQEKCPKIKKVPNYLELIERFHIFAPSKRKFWLSG